MKKVPFRTAFLVASAFTFSVGLTSCKNESKTEDPKEVAEEENKEVIDAAKEEAKAVEENSKIFVSVAAFDLQQRELSKLAQVKAVSKEVKDLAKTIEASHSSSFNEISELAKTKEISVPNALTDSGQKDYDALNKKSGQDFDVEYIDKTIKAHRDAIQDFTNKASQTQDLELKSWLEKKVMTLQTHFDAINAMIAKSNAKK